MVVCTDIQPCGERPLKFTVIAVRCGEKWLFCRKRGRDTWESAGGHIEPDETPLDGAVRELYEETGIKARRLVEVLDYFAQDEVSGSWGRVFLHVTDSVPTSPPAEHEMEETRLFDRMPDNMTYDGIARVIFPRITDFANNLNLLEV